MTDEDRAYWDAQTPEARNLEQERLLAIWLEQRCGTRFVVREARRHRLYGLRADVIFRGAREACKAVARAEAEQRSHPRIWVEHEDLPARLHTTAVAA